LDVVSVFFELFNAGGRHQIEESRRLESMREEEGQAEPGRGPIDLTSGRVFIKPKGKAAEADAEATAENDPSADEQP
jgi:Family of unknown function (DUF6191)